ncbi:MAG: hypothetical protein K2K15_02470, partial [Anaeroplasmataceae bacterium]|nr:hypothetical protein [Anaeroplasmataceae bacterium]
LRERLCCMKNILIIGSTGKIGRALVEAFPKDHVLEASRSLPNDMNQYSLDLANFESIKNFLVKIKYIPLDYLFMISGTFQEKKLTEDSLEVNFLANAFGPYFLVKHFLKHQPNCKIILTSSISICRAKLDLNPKKWKHIYRNTKLLEHMLMVSLEKEYHTNISYAHPGVVKSQLSLGLHNFLIRFWIKHFANTSAQGAQYIVEASKVQNCKNSWICPSGLFGLKGKPKLKKIKRGLELPNPWKEKIKKLEQEIEEKYGIRSF